MRLLRLFVLREVRLVLLLLLILLPLPSKVCLRFGLEFSAHREEVLLNEGSQCVLFCYLCFICRLIFFIVVDIYFQLHS